MTDLNSEQLNGKYKQAYEFAMNDHLQAKQDLDAAKQDIEELRFKLTEQQVKIDAMDAFNKLLEDRLNMAMVDRTRAIDQRAEYAVRLKMLEAIILEKPPETLG
jgi:ribosomal protein S4